MLVFSPRLLHHYITGVEKYMKNLIVGVKASATHKAAGGAHMRVFSHMFPQLRVFLANNLNPFPRLTHRQRIAILPAILITENFHTLAHVQISHLQPPWYIILMFELPGNSFTCQMPGPYSTHFPRQAVRLSSFLASPWLPEPCLRRIIPRATPFRVVNSKAAPFITFRNARFLRCAFLTRFFRAVLDMVASRVVLGRRRRHQHVGPLEEGISLHVAVPRGRTRIP